MVLWYELLPKKSFVVFQNAMTIKYLSPVSIYQSSWCHCSQTAQPWYICPFTKVKLWPNSKLNGQYTHFLIHHCLPLVSGHSQTTY